MSSRASADSATVRKGSKTSAPFLPNSLSPSPSLPPSLSLAAAVKAIQAKKRKGKTAKKPPETKPRLVCSALPEGGRQLEHPFVCAGRQLVLRRRVMRERVKR